MRRGRIIIFVILIIIIGLVVGVVALQAFLGGTESTEPQFVDVYIAGQRIPQGGDITQDVLGTISLPADKVVGVMYTTDELALLLSNKVARFDLDQGVVITESMITDKSSGGILIEPPQHANLIPPGMTAIGIPTTRLALDAYGVNDGAHVNVNACFLFVDVDPGFQSILPNSTTVLTGTGFVPETLPVVSLGAAALGADTTNPQGRLELDPSLQQPFYLIPTETQRPRVVCQTILQNVVVMKLGNFSLPQAVAQSTDPAAEPQTTVSEPQKSPDIVTLIVSPQDSVTLSYLVYTNAQIMLALRNSGDTARQATEAATLQFLLSQYNIPIPAKLPYALEPRIDELVAPSLPNDIVTVEPQQ
jgi:Flp pilus assembly protein CpaB